MPSVDINYLAVIVAALVNMVVGALWYSPLLFAKPWMKLIGKREEDFKSGASTGYAIATVTALVQAYVLTHFVSYAGATTLMEGIVTGFWVWLGFIATASLVTYVFSLRPLKLWAIDFGYYLIVLLINAGLLAVWR